MRIFFITAATVLFVAATCILACNSGKGNPKNTEGISELMLDQQRKIERGHYLVTIMACNDCHTPTIMTPHGPEKDTVHLLSGHPSNVSLPGFDQSITRSWALFSMTNTAIAGPWGVSFAANLTSDGTGIGNWSEQQFFKAFREGKFKGLDNARTLLPPMPWQIYSHVKDEDVSAIYAYLKSTRPVHNVVPQPIAPK